MLKLITIRYKLDNAVDPEEFIIYPSVYLMEGKYNHDIVFTHVGAYMDNDIYNVDLFDSNEEDHSSIKDMSKFIRNNMNNIFVATFVNKTSDDIKTKIRYIESICLVFSQNDEDEEHVFVPQDTIDKINKKMDKITFYNSLDKLEENNSISEILDENDLELMLDYYISDIYSED